MHGTNKFLILILLFWPLWPPASITAEPLKSHNLHPLYTSFAQFEPRSAALQKPDSARLYLIQSYGNNFFLDTEAGGNPEITAELDSEAAYTTLGVRYGFGNRIDASATLHLATHFPGVLDGFLQWYHGLFGFPNADRELRPDYGLRFYLENADRVILNEEAALCAISALQIEPRIRLFQDEGIPLALSAGSLIKIPINLASHDLLSGGFDIALRLYADYAVSRFSFNASVGAAYLSTPDILLESEFMNLVLPFSLTIEWQMQPAIAFVGTINGSTSPYQTGYVRADKFSSTFSFGSRFDLSPDSSLEVSMSQEFLTFAATDVALNIALSQHIE
ncbi:MAG: DUF3187 family protein [Spirochaetia bacterium]